MIFTELRLALTVPSLPSPKNTARVHVVGLGREVGIGVEAQAGHVVADADGEPLPRLRPGQLGQHGGDVGRRELLRRQAVAAARDLRHRARPSFGWCPVLGERGDHVQIERLAAGARLLRAVQDGDLPDRLGQGGQQCLRVKGAIQPHLHQPDLLPLGRQVVDRLLDHAAAGAHDHDHAIGVRRPVVVEQVVLPAHQAGELVHRLLHDAAAGVVEGIAGLAGLEERPGSGPSRGGPASPDSRPARGGRRPGPCRSSPARRPR